MKINRVDFLRMLRVVGSTGKDELLVEKGGDFVVPYEDGTGVLVGKGLDLGDEVVFIDLAALKKMLESFSEQEITITVEKGYMTLIGAGLKFGYRLADREAVEVSTREMVAKMEAEWQWVSAEFAFEDLKKIRKLIKTMDIAKITFSEKDGKLFIYVGDRQMFFGEMTLKGIGLKGELCFEAVKVDDILSVVDDNILGFAFGAREVVSDKTGDKYVEGILRVESGADKWLIGALHSG